MLFQLTFTTLGNSYSIDFIKQYFVEGNVNGKILTFTNTCWHNSSKQSR